MPQKQNARVTNGYLELQDGSGRFHPHIPVGSQAWFNWLANSVGFAYQDETGRFTARCEQVKGKGAYWYAYRRQGKKVRKKYLGKAAKLTPQRLQQIAVKLADATVNIPTLAVEAVPSMTNPTLALDEYAFLTTKFIAPSLPNHLVRRSRLTDLLDAPIIYISAPAGYGKSTLISHWLRQTQVPFAWVTLDESDDDPVNFWRYVLTAIGQKFPQISSTAVQPGRAFLTQFINNVQKLGGPLWLVLDDFHYIANETILEDTAFLLEHLPSRFHVVIISRTHPPFAVGRWRAKGRFVDLEADDLRFTANEGIKYLAHMPDLNRHEMLMLVDQMEGWITGLQLISLALRRRGDVRKYLAVPEKSFTYFKMYLLEDILQREPQHVQTFLLQIAILRTLNIDLCNAVTVLDTAATMLAYLEKENLFITAMPDRPGWYRLHQIFAEILVDQLQTQMPEQVLDLHLRAARWYRAAGVTENAVRHLLAAQSWEEAAGLIEKHAPALFIRGEVVRLQRWLEGLPLPVLQNHHLLLLTYARLSGDSLPEVISWLRQNSAATKPGSTGENTTDVGQLIDFLADMELALPEGEPTATSPATYHHLWQEIDLLLRSLSYWMAGDWQSAERVLEQAITLGSTYDHTYISLQAAGMLATQHVRQGHLRQGQQIMQQIEQQAQRPISQLTSSLIMGRCTIYYERNQLKEAHHLLTAELARIDAQRQRELYLRSRLLLIHVLSALTQQEAAETLMAAIVSEYNQKGLSWLSLEEIAAYQAYIWLQHDKLTLAEAWLNRSGLQGSDELTQENSYCQLVHAHIIIRQKQWVAAEQLLANLIASFPDGLRTEPFLKLLLPQCMALFGQGKVNQAVRMLRQGLQLAVPEGYIRPFLEHGSDMFTLLTLVGQQGHVSKEIQEHITTLLYILGKSDKSIPDITSAEIRLLSLAASITPREQELLQLVSQGLSNRKIADTMIISLNTVKSHLRRIYLKLEVQNRAQAVTRAKEMNII